MNKQLRGSLCLLLTALIWGLAFPFQSRATEHVSAFVFTAARSLITFAALSPFFFVRRRAAAVPDAPMASYIKIGLPLGAILFLATVLQQLGLMDPNASSAKSGFITSLYIVIVPLLGLFIGRKVSLNVWISVLFSLAGLCLLCLKETLGVTPGDLLTLGCALTFSLHILAVDRFAANLDSAKLCALQFGASGIFSLIIALAFERADFSGLRDCWLELLYVGVLSGAVGYTLQIVGQKHTNPTLASLLMCLESVFAALGGWMILREPLSPKELLGCALMLAACVLAQLPQRKRQRLRA